MLSNDSFKKGFVKLLVVFPNWRIKSDDPVVMQVWYDYFKNMTDEEYSEMVDSYIGKEKMIPTVAGLKDHASQGPLSPAHKLFPPEGE